jgi:hypothetical protein
VSGGLCIRWLGGRRSPLPLALTLTGAACGGDAPTAPLEPCGAPVEVRVSQGARGEIMWTARCGVTWITVVEAPRVASVGTVWSIRAAPGTAIAPGVRYGEPPSGTRELTPAIPVEPGWVYAVSLTRADQVTVGSVLGRP